MTNSAPEAPAPAPSGWEVGTACSRELRQYFAGELAGKVIEVDGEAAARILERFEPGGAGEARLIVGQRQSIHSLIEEAAPGDSAGRHLPPTIRLSAERFLLAQHADASPQAAAEQAQATAQLQVDAVHALKHVADIHTQPELLERQHARHRAAVKRRRLYGGSAVALGAAEIAAVRVTHTPDAAILGGLLMNLAALELLVRRTDKTERQETAYERRAYAADGLAAYLPPVVSLSESPVHFANKESGLRQGS